MAELVDALDLGSSSAMSEGSSPFVRIFSISQCRLSDFPSTLWVSRAIKTVNLNF